MNTTLSLDITSLVWVPIGSYIFHTLTLVSLARNNHHMSLGGVTIVSLHCKVQNNTLHAVKLVALSNSFKFNSYMSRKIEVPRLSLCV